VWDHLPSGALHRRFTPPTTNYGLDRARPHLDAREHLERQRHRGDDGYTIMDAYNRVLPATVNYRQPGGALNGHRRGGNIR
jgi:hypothetical protein